MRQYISKFVTKNSQTFNFASIKGEKKRNKSQASQKRNRGIFDVGQTKISDLFRLQKCAS